MGTTPWRHLIRLGLAVTVVVGAAGAAGPSTQPAAPRTIVVLDFANRDPGDGNDWLGKGLADMVITDLSASRRLVVLDRERTALMARELGLAQAGLLEPDTAARMGRAVAADWVLFGSYRVAAGRLSLTGLMLDLQREQLRRVERLEGAADAVFELQRQLVDRVLTRLDAPFSRIERRLIEPLRPSSVPALERYAHSLEHFDNGRWMQALLEARLAVRADNGYLKALARMAELYLQLKDPAHAATVYRQAAARDRHDRLPDWVYLHMGQTLEAQPGGQEEARSAYQRIVRRHPGLTSARLLAPPPIVGRTRWSRFERFRMMGKTHETALRALERLALLAAEAGDEPTAAGYYSRIVEHCVTRQLVSAKFCRQLAPPQAGTGVGGFYGRVWRAYVPLYGRMVATNRDGRLYPPLPTHVLPESRARVGPPTRATHGLDRAERLVWLAPPGREIAEVILTFADTSESAENQAWRRRFSTDRAVIGWSAIDEPLFRQGRLVPVKKATTRIGWPVPPGIRTVHFSPPCPFQKWSLHFELRPWSGPEKPWLFTMGPHGRLFVEVAPPMADLYVDGKHITRARDRMILYEESARRPQVPDGPVRHGVRITQNITDPHLPRLTAGEHELEVRWSDGRRARRTFRIGTDGEVRLFVTPPDTPCIFPGTASHPRLLVDGANRIWCVWDQSIRGEQAEQPSLPSDLWAATSPDGTAWSRPRRLPVSSTALDMQPVLQQDREGTYWLVWLSDRDPEDPKRPWIASSADGRQWSFPRKVDLPVIDKVEARQWRQLHAPRHAFLIDPDGTFWIVWRWRLYRSEDGKRWTDVDWFRRISAIPQDASYGLVPDAQGRLLLSVCTDRPSRGSLWRREGLGRWTRAARFSKPRRTRWAGMDRTSDGGWVVAYQSNGIWLRTCDAAGSWAPPVRIAANDGPNRHYHPTLAMLPGGKCIVAYASPKGLMAHLCNPTIPAPATREDVTARPVHAWTNSLSQRMVRVEPGRFMMGSPSGERDREDDEWPQRRVRISKRFAVSAHEVTVAQFGRFVEASGYKTDAELGGAKITWRNPDLPGAAKPSDAHPVVQVTWHDASAFCQWLSEKEGRAYRLPTEAEWEYAARAGTTTAYQWGDRRDAGKAWCNGFDWRAKQALTQTHWPFLWDDGHVGPAPVGRFGPNAWGLYDMHGNVAEWCADVYKQTSYLDGPEIDPRGPKTREGNPQRVVRGGSWGSKAGTVRSAARAHRPALYRSSRLGFRILSPAGE